MNSCEESVTGTNADQGVLKFNRLALCESSFTPEQWQKLAAIMAHGFSQTVKRLRVWDCCTAGSTTHLGSTQPSSFDDCIAKVFEAVEYKHGGLLELDLQYVDLGPSSIAALGRVLFSVRQLKKFTYISESTAPFSSDNIVGSMIVTNLEAN